MLAKPVSIGLELVNALIHVGEELLHVGETLLHVGEALLHVGEARIQVGGAQIHVGLYFLGKLGQIETVHFGIGLCILRDGVWCGLTVMLG